jgi:hypothetical protein
MEDRNQFDYTSKKARAARYVKSVTQEVYDSLEDAWNALDELRDVVDGLIEETPDEELPSIIGVREA